MCQWPHDMCQGPARQSELCVNDPWKDDVKDASMTHEKMTWNMNASLTHEKMVWNMRQWPARRWCEAIGTCVNDPWQVVPNMCQGLSQVNVKCTRQSLANPITNSDRSTSRSIANSRGSPGQTLALQASTVVSGASFTGVQLSYFLFQCLRQQHWGPIVPWLAAAECWTCFGIRRCRGLGTPSTCKLKVIQEHTLYQSLVPLSRRQQGSLYPTHLQVEQNRFNRLGHLSLPSLCKSSDSPDAQRALRTKLAFSSVEQGYLAECT